MARSKLLAFMQLYWINELRYQVMVAWKESDLRQYGQQFFGIFDLRLVRCPAVNYNGLLEWFENSNIL